MNHTCIYISCIGHSQAMILYDHALFYSSTFLKYLKIIDIYIYTQCGVYGAVYVSSCDLLNIYTSIISMIFESHSHSLF